MKQTHKIYNTEIITKSQKEVAQLENCLLEISKVTGFKEPEDVKIGKKDEINYLVNDQWEKVMTIDINGVDYDVIERTDLGFSLKNMWAAFSYYEKTQKDDEGKEQSLDGLEMLNGKTIRVTIRGSRTDNSVALAHIQYDKPRCSFKVLDTTIRTF
ncbi:hypothetical protein BG261_02745 [Floricoccus tropicus]|uniref:Uncharacterized protein n=1 Tax=Floricoccus tropicus TaxID=1859473 RepID=A0A1E8GMP0_9LACT|nr:hypothetical protein [Floricoccus tropicus]OFI49514.1 hypothetical protein BG261_02745 [Floricoccus tropicus]